MSATSSVDRDKLCQMCDRKLFSLVTRLAAGTQGLF